MARGNRERAWTYQEYVDGFEKLERENRSLKIRLDMYDQDATDLIEKHGCDPEDKIDREDLKRMLNCLIGKNRKLQAKVILSESQNYCKICGNILDGYIPPKEKK